MQGSRCGVDGLFETHVSVKWNVERTLLAFSLERCKKYCVRESSHEGEKVKDPVLFCFFSGRGVAVTKPLYRFEGMER